MADFEPATTTFSAKNALLLASAAQAAYLDEPAALARVAALGLPNFKWIDLTEDFAGLHAFAASCDKFAILAFRGTLDTKDWMDDLQATPVRFNWLFEGGPEVGDVHAGFGHALRDAWDDINAALEVVAPRPAGNVNLASLATFPQRTFWITGHSLGGALAVLAGAAFSMLPHNVIRPINGIYTFGQPRIGLLPFCGNYDQLLHPKTYRFVNRQDLVPRVPFRGWDYSDIGQMIHFDSSGIPRLQSTEWTSFLSRTIESFQDFFSIATNVRTDIGDHSMDGYFSVVDSNQAALVALFP
jgi:triacylglycerol lipase